jgi:hypothetical protein
MIVDHPLAALLHVIFHVLGGLHVPKHAAGPVRPAVERDVLGNDGLAAAGRAFD